MLGKDYAYFIEIARQQSLQTASDLLFVSPSTLSKYVQRLENDLGLQLFERVGKRFILTYAGHRYLAWCQRMKAVEDRCQRELQHISANGKKILRLGFPSMHVKCFLNSIIPAFLREHPRIELSIYERNSSQIWPMFFDNKLDLVFMYKNPATLSGNIQNAVVSTENMVLCVPKGHAIASASQSRAGFPYPWIDLRAVEHENLIVVSESAQEVVGSIESIFNQYIPAPHIVMRAMVLESIAIGILQGIGISILPDRLLHLLGYRNCFDLYSFGETPVICQYRAFHYAHSSVEQEICALIDLAEENLRI